MVRFRNFFGYFLAVALGTVVLSTDAHGHFLWLITDAPSSPHALMYFGESSTERDYHFPDRLAKVVIRHRVSDQPASTVVDVVEYTEDEFVGLRSKQPLSREGVLETHCQYGVYHGALLTYYAKHFLAPRPAEWMTLGASEEAALDAVPNVGQTPDELVLTVYWHGEPVSNASVSREMKGKQDEKVTTDETGQAVFSGVTEGPQAFLIHFAEKDLEGELDGEKYTSGIHYCSLTLTHSLKPALPDLPEAISSFGAAVAEEFLYIYGGHIGTAHDHSRDNLSQRFARIPLRGPQAWEELPFEVALQGLALVAHAGHIYRVGGMTATNAWGDVEELDSTSAFLRFDPDRRLWTALPPLPEPRSSHDAVVIGNQLYVVGGWKLSGHADDGQWHSTSLVYDLEDPQAEWHELPAQPFTRRALAVGELDGKLIVIGGIDDNGDISRRVDVFDPVSASWSLGQELPGEGMNGFGVSAWNVQGALYASGSNGTVYRLSTPQGAWETCGQLQCPRFFHRLLPGLDGSLMAIGGASHQGHVQDIEIMPLDEATTVVRKTTGKPQ